MAIRFKCDACGRVLTVKDELAGKKGKCPGCGGVIEVPQTSQKVEEAPQVPGPASPPTAETPPTPAPVEVPPAAAADQKPCPHCGESIAKDAVFCVLCGTDLRTGQAVGETAEASASIEEPYNYLKTAPDLITKPAETLDTIMNAPPNAMVFKKAIILFAAGLLVFTIAIPYNSDPLPVSSDLVPAFVVAFVLGVVVLFSDAIMCSVGGGMFGSRPAGFAHVFMGVLSVRAIVGLVMIVSLVFVYTDMGMIAGWVTRVIRFGWGSYLIYLVISQAYEVPPLQAIAFAVGAGGVQGMLFLIPRFFGIYII